jgi:MoxR-like ATPase
MAVTPGTEGILDAAKSWRETALVGRESIFTGEPIWTATYVQELVTHFVQQPDTGEGGFLDKFRQQLATASQSARKLAAEMLWVMMLFPSNITRSHKTNLVAAVWEWSGEPFDREHPLVEQGFTNAFGSGIGSGGMSYNSRRPNELEFFIRIMQRWNQESPAVHGLLESPWAFANWLDRVKGADTRQLRHMLLHLLFPHQFERISSGAHKRKIVAVFGHLAEPGTVEMLTDDDSAWTTQDKRILRIRRVLEERYPSQWLDFYHPPLWEQWGVSEPSENSRALAAILEEMSGMDPALPSDAISSKRRIDDRKSTSFLATGDFAEEANATQIDPPEVVPPPEPYDEPPFETVRERVLGKGMRIDDTLLRRYALALGPRGFVILTGASGTGKTWLAEAYAEAVGARHLIVPVAPNWTTNEDLLGYQSPLTGQYHDTPFSRFLREASDFYQRAQGAGVRPRPYHVVLDEMNLARAEHYFARFLSALEVRDRHGHAFIDLGPNDAVMLPPNVFFVGTVNMDETTHGFADKVYDRAQQIEMQAPREMLEAHLEGKPYAKAVIEVWEALSGVAPFAFRVLDEMARYHDAGQSFGVTWETLVDEQILQKVLPRIRGSNPSLEPALLRLEEITAGRFPRSHEKVTRMRDRFTRYGVVSFH